MELTAKDLVVLTIDAYLLPFQRDIKRAKETYSAEIENLTETLAKIAGKDAESPHYIAAKSLQEDNNVEFYMALMDIKQKYSRSQIVEAQKRKYKKANRDRFF